MTPTKKSNKEIEIIYFPRDKRLDSYRGRLEIAGGLLNEIYKKTKTTPEKQPYTATCLLDRVIEHLKEAIKIYDKNLRKVHKK